MQIELIEGSAAERSRSLHEDIESITPTNLISGVTSRSAWRDDTLCFCYPFSIWLLSGSTSLPSMKTTSPKKMTRRLRPATRIARSGSNPTNLCSRNLPILGSSRSASCLDTGSFPCLCLCPCCGLSPPGSRGLDGQVSRTRNRVWRPSRCLLIGGRRPSSCLPLRWIAAP